MEIKKVGVVGCGLMGHGIAQVSAQSGYEVVVREVSQEKLDSGLGKIKKQLARAVEKGRMEQSAADEVLTRITPTLKYEDFAECDLVVEAITEDLDAKRGDVGGARPDRQAGGTVRDQHVVAPSDQPGRRHGAAGAFHRPALLQPGAGDAAARGRAVDPLQHRRARGRLRMGQVAQEDRGPRAGQGGLHREPPADPLPAGRDPRLRGGLRVDRADRRRR